MKKYGEYFVCKNIRGKFKEFPGKNQLLATTSVFVKYVSYIIIIIMRKLSNKMEHYVE